MLNCIIVDDEPLARDGLASYVKEVDFLQLVNTCENPVELMKLLDKQPVDLIFLDIQMPKMNGIDFLKIFQKPPMVVLTTAFPSYALESFQLNVLDYLLKPITFERFFQAANKAKEYHHLVNRNSGSVFDADYFFIKCDYKYEKIYFDDIRYIQGLQNYVTICTSKDKYVTLLTLKNVEENLDPQAFIRVHKSYIVPVSKIEAIENNDIIIESFRIPISRNYRDEVISRVINKKLWKKPGGSSHQAPN